MVSQLSGKSKLRDYEADTTVGSSGGVVEEYEQTIALRCFVADEGRKPCRGSAWRGRGVFEFSERGSSLLVGVRFEPTELRARDATEAGSRRREAGGHMIHFLVISMPPIDWRPDTRTPAWESIRGTGRPMPTFFCGPCGVEGRPDSLSSVSPLSDHAKKKGAEWGDDTHAATPDGRRAFCILPPNRDALADGLWTRLVELAHPSRHSCVRGRARPPLDRCKTLKSDALTATSPGRHRHPSTTYIHTGASAGAQDGGPSKKGAQGPSYQPTKSKPGPRRQLPKGEANARKPHNHTHPRQQ